MVPSSAQKCHTFYEGRQCEAYPLNEPGILLPGDCLAVLMSFPQFFHPSSDTRDSPQQRQDDPVNEYQGGEEEELMKDQGTNHHQDTQEEDPKKGPITPLVERHQQAPPQLGYTGELEPVYPIGRENSREQNAQRGVLTRFSRQLRVHGARACAGEESPPAHIPAF